MTILQKVQNKVLTNIYKIPFLRNPAELAYQAALEKHVGNLPVISSSDESLVEKIRSEGVVVTSLEALGIPFTSEMLRAANHLMPKIPKSIFGTKNEYVVHATPQQMMEYPDIFTWGLEQRLLNIVENYIALPVAYHGTYFRRDLANDVQIKSRLWHIDKEDRKVLKIIVYLNDVSEDGGPFEYIPQDFTATVADSLKYDYSYVKDKTMQQVLPSTNWKSCTGTAGTVVFAATSTIFHRGKTPVDSDRFTLFFDYTSRTPKHPFYCKSSLPEEDLISLSPKLSEREKQCIFWREQPLVSFNRPKGV